MRHSVCFSSSLSSFHLQVIECTCNMKPKWFWSSGFHSEKVDSLGIHVKKRHLAIRLHLKHPLLYLYLFVFPCKHPCLPFSVSEVLGEHQSQAEH